MGLLRNMMAGGSTVGDPLYDYVTSYLKFEGNSNDTAIIDERGPIWQAFAGAKLTNSSSKFGGTCLDCTVDGVYTNSVKTSVHSTDFAIECFFTCGSSGTSQWPIFQRSNGNAGSVTNLQFFCAAKSPAYGSNMGASVYIAGTRYDVIGPTTAAITSNGFHYVKLSRQGNNLYLQVDNTLYGPTALPDADLQDQGISWYTYFGRYQESGVTNVLGGMIDCARITRGDALDPTTVVVPTKEFDNTGPAGDQYWGYVVSLLRSIGRVGTHVVVDDVGNNWSNFNDLQVGSIGGQEYLKYDGNGDYATAPYIGGFNLSSGDWTIDGVAQLAVTPTAEQQIICKDGQFGASYPQYVVSFDAGRKIKAGIGSGTGVSYIQTISSTSVIDINTDYQWSFRKGGASIYLGVNGVQEATAVQSGVITNNGAKPLYIGYQQGQSIANYLNGATKVLRLTKGVDRGNSAPNSYPNYPTIVSTTDDFSINTIADYTQYADAGGAVWTISGGVLTRSGTNNTQAVLIHNDAGFLNGEISCTISQATDGGLVLRFIDNANYYVATIHDSADGTGSNYIRLFKKVNGTYTALGGSLPISFISGTAHTFTFRIYGSTLQVDFDGNTLSTVVDTSIAAPGYAGARGNYGPCVFDSLTWKVK